MIEIKPDGTVIAYITKDLRPADKSTAEMVKITRPDGSIQWGYRVAGKD